MKREILFRGFCPDENGTQEIWTDGTCNGEKVKGGIKGEWIEGYSFKIWDKCYILWGTTNDIPNMIEVIPETVGQWTGLTDKNGKNVFVWDILKSNYVSFIVKPTINGWGLFKYDNGRIGRLSSMQYIHKYEVIGTIFDNEGV